ncbi:MAG TPA: DUF1349 domain-containing protein [Flavisolibacter sp.]|nr:DUF1349 domain-containing protein [Flavisolibacter sp.]
MVTSAIPLYMQWYNEPTKWQKHNNRITIEVEGGTDYWRVTHYQFIRDTGHFFFHEVSGEFIARVKVTALYKDLYDQAGLMIRLDEANWIKTGVEFVNGIHFLSAVVTRVVSDWSVAQPLCSVEQLYLLLIRKSDFVEIRYSLDNKDFHLLRLAPFPANMNVKVGVMCAAPEGNGFTASFDDFTIERLSESHPSIF